MTNNYLTPFETFLNRTDEKVVIRDSLRPIVSDFLVKADPRDFVFLDIGCGNGKFSKDIFGIIKQNIPLSVYCGVDVLQECIDAAKSEFAGATRFYKLDISEKKMNLRGLLKLSNVTIFPLISHVVYYPLRKGMVHLDTFIGNVKELITSVPAVFYSLYK